MIPPRRDRLTATICGRRGGINALRVMQGTAQARTPSSMRWRRRQSTSADSPRPRGRRHSRARPSPLVTNRLAKSSELSLRPAMRKNRYIAPSGGALSMPGRRESCATRASRRLQPARVSQSVRRVFDGGDARALDERRCAEVLNSTILAKLAMKPRGHQQPSRKPVMVQLLEKVVALMKRRRRRPAPARRARAGCRRRRGGRSVVATSRCRAGAMRQQRVQSPAAAPSGGVVGRVDDHARIPQAGVEQPLQVEAPAASMALKARHDSAP